MDNFVPQDWLILLITAVVAFVVVYGLRWLILARHIDISREKILPRQLILIVITIIAFVAVVLALPVSESSRNQVLGLLGVLVSGIIAFSSTTIVANFMAGLILRVNQPFKTGDYIKCANFAGRVTDKGILDTEIQTEQRTLVHIANSFILANPVEVVRSSGTFISVEVSIGFDVHHATIAKHLEQAAKTAGLSDPFVHVTALGNFSVNYKVSGMLLDTKSLLTSRSKLHICVLDQLHNNDIEIMSPNFMSTRAVEPAQKFMAKAHVKQVKDKVNQEDLAFDKAEEAEQNEQLRLSYEADIAALKVKLTDSNSEQKEVIKTKIASLQEKHASISEAKEQKD
jgi:small conductance mechanosensitive channel